MIKSIWGITHEPFKRELSALLAQQKHILDIIKIHAQQGGFSVVIGQPGVGKTVLREHIESLAKQREITIVSCSRTLHTYRQILWQMGESLKLETTERAIETDLIQCAFTQVRERKTLYILIDEAHLLELSVPGNVRELRNMIERLVILTPGDEISGRDAKAFLPIDGGASQSTYYRPGTPLREMVDAVERDLILRALEHHKNHITNTALDLGLERSHLYKKMKALEIKR